MRTGTCSQRSARLGFDPRPGDDRRRPVVGVSAGVLALWPTLLVDLRAAGLSAMAVAPGRPAEGPAPGLVLLGQRDVDPREARGLEIAPGGSAGGARPEWPRVVRVVPAGDRARYADALDGGAAGVVPDDAPAGQVVQALEAALRGQVLLPADVLRHWLGQPLGRGPAAD